MLITDEPITLENFGPYNRDCDGADGNLYRICNTDPANGSGSWYVLSITNNETTWKQEIVEKGSLQECIDFLNSRRKTNDD